MQKDQNNKMEEENPALLQNITELEASLKLTELDRQLDERTKEMKTS